jgi:hypothetical protein
MGAQKQGSIILTSSSIGDGRAGAGSLCGDQSWIGADGARWRRNSALRVRVVHRAGCGRNPLFSRFAIILIGTTYASKNALNRWASADEMAGPIVNSLRPMRRAMCAGAVLFVVSRRLDCGGMVASRARFNCALIRVYSVANWFVCNRVCKSSAR